MFTLGTLRNNSASQQNINSCSHCTGATFETEQKPIRYSVNIALVYLGRWHRKSVMTCMLVLSGRVELMVMHGVVKNNYEHNVVVMNLPLCPQTADDVNVSLVNELQISNIQKLVTAYFLSAS